VADDTLPHAMEVERGAIAMAAIQGMVWASLTSDQRQIFRRLAHACALSFGAAARSIGEARLIASGAAAVTAMRNAAARIDSDADDLAGDLYRLATDIEQIWLVAATTPD
jgi:hypothetical protein